MCINYSLQLELIQFKNTLQKNLIKYTQKLSEKKAKTFKIYMEKIEICNV